MSSWEDAASIQIPHADGGWEGTGTPSLYADLAATRPKSPAPPTLVMPLDVAVGVLFELGYRAFSRIVRYFSAFDADDREVDRADS